MASAVDHHEPQRSWWQKSPSDKPHSHSKQSGIKFNTLASAMGFKQKKPQPPALTIHEPYPPVSSPAVHLVPRTEPHQRRPYTAPTVGMGMGRPPSNSVSSSRSPVDSLEPTTPRTPDDSGKTRRGSLLTLSDVDPFAARVVSVHSPSGPNRLSAFSNSSAADTKSNGSVSRVSYASSSSQSFRLGGDLSPLSIVSPASEAGSSYMSSNKLSGHNLRRNDVSNDSWLSGLGGDSNRFSQPEPPPKPRPVLRARGMTDGGIERTNFLRNDPFLVKPVPSPQSSHSASSPTIPARQLSLSRPTPPPSHELPPPPPSVDDRNSAGSASSTSLTFSVSADFMPISYSPRTRAKTSYETAAPKPVESGWEPDVSPRSTPRTLKKSVSHQSLTKRGQSSSASSSAAPLPEPASIKAPRKQRSFHQQRLPVPAMPLQLPLSEQRATDPALSTRKRLFSVSSSRRPSQSTIPIADDARSLSAASEPDRGPPSSCWIDIDQPPRSPSSAVHEYTPQQIMSPAEMLKVEASVNAAYQRPRGESIISSSTSMSMSDFENDFGLSPTSSFGGGRSRSKSDHPSMRSGSTSEQANSQEMFYNTMAPQPPSPPILMSLPPPPRRAKPRTASLSRSQSEVAQLSPPPRKNVRPKISVEERLHRQSIMRKPSFLDIDDEMDREPPALMRQASFLDLTRGSFDSIRSVDPLDYN
ncbi:hypothetical protein DFH09DRAFT_1102001 [Mycena vulgaris]|nr:hypothetical protein DFH09DRAFT_1102001 [Mycena vulgaris]